MKYLPYIVMLFLYACANVVPPTGGIKDEKPPVWNRTLSIPDSINIINFQSQTITLVFDEDVDVKNLQKEIISNPSIGKNINYKTKKKKITFNIEEELLPNTTYVINFGNSIVDITESNPAKNVIVAFSTGSHIDSLQIKGKVIDNYTLEPIKNVVVGLYIPNDTLNISKHKPLYYAKADNSGNYQFDYIKNGTYLLRAFEDINNNTLYDTYTEQVGFVAQEITLDSNLHNINFNLFKESPDTLYLKSVKKSDYYISINTTQGIKEYGIKTDSGEVFAKLANKEIQLYTTNKNITFDLHITDSLSQTIDTTLKITNFSPRTTQIKNLINEKESIDFQIVNNKITANIQFSTPLQSIIYDSIEIIHATDTLRAAFDSLFSYNFHYFGLELNSKFNFTDSLIINFKEGSLTNIYDVKNKIEKIQYIKKNPKSYGLLAGNLETNYTNFILQLINNKKTVVREIINETQFEFATLEPGTYTIRIIHDTDNNQKYSIGKLKQLIPAEEVYYHPNVIQLKANWEIRDILINTNSSK